MNGWDTIKVVREELSEASSQAKKGNKSTAKVCLIHAMTMLGTYSEQAKGPDYGFEEVKPARANGDKLFVPPMPESGPERIRKR